MSKIIGIIPARMKSSRFPGKPMAKIHGVQMIGHVYYRSRMCDRLDKLYVATPDQEIFDYIESIGGEPIMTSDSHKMCNDRVLEALLKIESQKNEKFDIIINIQGDQPMVFPRMIEDVTKPLTEDESILCATMMDKIQKVEDHDNPNKIKVVVDLNNFALYFSREPIPSRKKAPDTIPMYRHVALTALRRDFFLKMNSVEMTPLETAESIDDIRYLEYGYKVKMVLTDYETDTVDTPADLKSVEIMMADDPLIPTYRNIV